MVNGYAQDIEAIVAFEGVNAVVDHKSEQELRKDRDIEPRYLSQTGLSLYIHPEEKPLPPVPPLTPKELISDCYVTILPTIPESLERAEIPCIREIGIRDSIEILAPHFNCADYKNNLVQFWFLDMLVDCIWRAQDEYKFSFQEQQLIIEWILFVVKLTTSHNMTKPLMFKIFNEAISIAEDYIQSRGPKSPTPDTLFTLTLEDSTDEPYSLNSISTNLLLTPEASKQYFVIKLQEDLQVFKVPNGEAALDDCLSSSIDPPSENDVQIDEPAQDGKQEITDSESSIEYYKSNMSTPSRFQSLQEIEPIIQAAEREQEVEEECGNTVREWLNIPRKQIAPECPSVQVTKMMTLTHQVEEEGRSVSVVKVKEKRSSVEPLETHLKEELELVLDNEKIFKTFYDYNMWQLNNEYMADSTIGWTPSLTSYKNIFKSNKLKKESEKNNAETILGAKNRSDKIENTIFINLCALMAVKQIVFDYFNYNFSFELIRISLKYPQYLITQDINDEWNIPKEIKGELKKPMPKKPKKQKVAKEKKPKGTKDAAGKKSKSSKGSKSAKSKDKTDKDKKGKDKKQKDKKSKTDKKSKSSKLTDKSKKVSKEEKKEMDRIKKEEEEAERQRLKAEENKHFMFPLKDAVDDNFFSRYFPGYKGKKAGKKGDKSSKSTKSSKSDKSSKNDKHHKKK